MEFKCRVLLPMKQLPFVCMFVCGTKHSSKQKYFHQGGLSAYVKLGGDREADLLHNKRLECLKTT